MRSLEELLKGSMALNGNLCPMAMGYLKDVTQLY